MRKMCRASVLLMVMLLSVAGCANQSTSREMPTPQHNSPTIEPTSSYVFSMKTIGLVTNGGALDDGTFNEFAHRGAQQVADEFGLSYYPIVSPSPDTHRQNIQMLIDDGADIIITVGFMMNEMTIESAQAYPHILFIGVDQSVYWVSESGESHEPPPNMVGIQARDDQAGFLAGAMAGMMTQSGMVAIMAGPDILPIRRFRHGYEQGVRYVSPQTQVLTASTDSFLNEEHGHEMARQFVEQGADVIFGAAGRAGSAAILTASELGAFVIGVDQDQYVTTFQNGTMPGADRLLTSAIKYVDVGVYLQVKDIMQGRFVGGQNFLLTAENGGIDYADFHQTEPHIPQAVKQSMETIHRGLADGTIDTGVDSATGELIPTPP